MKKPNKLNIGDKVAIVSLSSGIIGEEDTQLQVELGVRRLTYMGITPVFMPNSRKGLAYIKDNPKARASDLKDAFKDPEIKAIICAIGGDDTYKTIPYLMDDPEFKDLVNKNPKIFIGSSQLSNELPVTIAGDSINISFDSDAEEVIDVASFDNLKLGVKK